MKVAIVGSRNFPELDRVAAYVDRLPLGTIVVSGGADGVDAHAIKRAKKRGLRTQVFRADWAVGRYAGFDRNTRIAEFCDRAVAFWDGQSNGTRDTIRKVRLREKPIEVYFPGELEPDT